MRTIYTPSLITKDEEDKLWESGLIVFDTSALLDFYYLVPEYQKVIATLLDAIKHNVWIPNQVLFEYKNNYHNALTKPQKENYDKTPVQKNKIVNELKDCISNWEKKYYHPYISDDKLVEIKDHLAEIEPRIAAVKKIIDIEYQNRRKEIEDIKTNDLLKEAIEKLPHGEPFLFSEVKEIINEGHIRYQNSIPPGYKDREGKMGVRKFGDLIIWKEIIRVAKEIKRNIIFVSNDVKEDWIITQDTHDCLKTENSEYGNPRRELLAEFEEETNQTIWFYKASDFINKIEQVYKTELEELIAYTSLEDLGYILRQKERERLLYLNHKGDSVFVRCNNCDELIAIDSETLYFYWELNSTFERGMGTEVEYLSQHQCQCPNCGNDINIDFRSMGQIAG